MRQELSAQCASDLQLDEWLGGELQAPAQAELAAHVASCSRCRARQQQLVAQREAFARSPAAVTPAWLRATSDARPAGRRLAVSLSCAALAAAVLLAVVVGKREPVGERVKGGEHVSIFVKRGDQVQRGSRTQRVRPGDKLRFAYTAMTPRYLAIVSVDAAAQVSVYYPAAEHAAQIEPGVEVPLPSAVELDAVLGEERVFALFCEQALPIATLRAEVAKNARVTPALAGCTVDELRLTKEAVTQ